MRRLLAVVLATTLGVVAPVIVHATDLSMPVKAVPPAPPPPPATPETFDPYLIGGVAAGITLIVLLTQHHHHGPVSP